MSQVTSGKASSEAVASTDDRLEDSLNIRETPFLRQGILALVRVTLGLILFSSGFNKAKNPYDFLAAVYDYQVVGPETGLWIARALPLLEMSLGCFLIVGFCRVGSFAISTLVFLLFVVAQVIAYSNGLTINCGCDSPLGEGVVSLKSILVTASLLCISSLGVVLSFKEKRSVLADRVG